MTRDALTVETFRAETDGCLGYLIVDEPSGTALAVDPRLDQVDRFQDTLTRRRIRLAYVLDTHTHADHLSGVRRLGERTGATVLAHAASKLKGESQRVKGGSTIDLGGSRLTLLDAPGHTPDALAILANGRLFTGDSLFVGGAGRTDFPGGSSADLFETLRQFDALPDETVVHPGHDYVGRAVSTIGEEKAHNPVLGERDRATFVARFSGRAEPPAHMAAILGHNIGDIDTATILPRDVHALRREGRDVVVLDVRSRLEFEGDRIDGSVNIPADELEGRVGEVPIGREVVLVCRTGVRATIAADVLARAGQRARVLEGGIHAWQRARLPLLGGRKRLPVDRQVQLIAGSMVLTGVALGAFVHPWFLALAAFFGAGLTFAGATGTCGLALVLFRMPWNRPLAGGPPGGATAATCAAPMTPVS
jgi:glyoxylase-like metal-dependent hydrolase (beta-lactamase superfamily II)/rhodanese-related sulfurtransferase